MRPEIITGTFQMALDAPPLLCNHEPEHVSIRREQRYIPLLMTQSLTVGSMERCNSYRCCYMYGGVSRMSICPTSRLVLWVTICVPLCYIKAWGLYDDITVHFPCSLGIFFVLSFEGEVCVGKVFIHEHPLWQYSKRKQRKFGALHEMFSGKKLTDACRFGISSPPVTGKKDVSPAFCRIWSVCSSPFLCEKCLCETWCQFITLPMLDSSCCMVSFGCITRTLMLRSPCAQQVKSSKLAWPGWWGSMLPGYVDGVRRFSQGAWEGGRRERRRGESGRTEGRCDQQERKQRVGGKINVQRGESSWPGEKIRLWTSNKI